MSFLPAYIQTASINPRRYQVLKADDLGIYFFPGKDEIRPGVHVKLLNQAFQFVRKGYVAQLQKGLAQIKLFASVSQIVLESIQFCELDRVWNIAITTPTQMVPNNQIFLSTSGQTALLNCVCLTPEDHVAGRVSWSLFYTPTLEESEIEVIRGHDYFKKNYVFFQKPGFRWKVGVYELIAQRYSDRGNVLSQDSKSWILSQPTNQLSCGEYNDPLSPLNLL